MDYGNPLANLGLQYRRVYYDLVMCYKIYHNLVDLPFDSFFMHQTGQAILHQRSFLYSAIQVLVFFRAPLKMATPARKAMKQYWDKWAEYKTESGTAFEMMLLETSGYDYTKKLSDLDVKEMTSLLPDLQGVDLLELGAGVG